MFWSVIPEMHLKHISLIIIHMSFIYNLYKYIFHLAYYPAFSHSNIVIYLSNLTLGRRLFIEIDCVMMRYIIYTVSLHLQNKSFTLKINIFIVCRKTTRIVNTLAFYMSNKLFLHLLVMSSYLGWQYGAEMFERIMGNISSVTEADL